MDSFAEMDKIALEEGEESSVLTNIKPMQPLVRPTQYMRGIASLHQHYKLGNLLIELGVHFTM